MNNSQNNQNTGEKEDQYLKDMKFNTLVFEQKLQKLKKKAQELQQKDNKVKIIYKTKPINKNTDNKFTTNEKPKTLVLNKVYSTTNIHNKNNNNKSINNTNNNLSRNESKELNFIISPDYSINHDTNTSISNMYYTMDDDFFNDNSIRKDYKIRELIKKNKQLKSEIEYKDNIIESLQNEIEVLKGNKEGNENKENKEMKENKEEKEKNIMIENNIFKNKLDEVNFELGRLTREIEEKNQKIDNYEINNKNLTIKIENLVMQNKNLSNKEKKLIDKNEYLSTNLDKIKDDNENYKKKNYEIGKIEPKFVERL